MFASLAMLLVVATDTLVALLGLDGWRYVVLTVLTLAFATLAPGLAKKLAGSFEIVIGHRGVQFSGVGRVSES